ncbi:class I SAM-dependent methyltransferase [Micrococcus porci]|uniref:class I SAM-dependent methyltransferase n=1 Tax=Micrococcus porci TaxID=2856555 RepID=UPI001CCD9CD8|nr:class I SAM-dependent methyltransferase [Micrococcus porci]UBH25005.1 class I SAM-dependent methyltransferase [Micrococcus porci]
MTPSDPNGATYDDARLAALYDHDNPPGEDHAYFRQVADESRARRIVDLGCGTGSLTVTFAGEGRAVVGIDPAEAMLAVARARPGGNAVTWRQGTAELIEPASADLVVMSGNVAMHLIGEVWHATLRRVATGLVPGGRLVFETRNPVLRAWEDWSHGPTERTTPAGRLLETETVTAPDADGVVLMRSRTVFLADGALVEAEQRLQFRSAAQVRADLDAVGLTVERISGDWHRTPFDDATDRLMGVEARKA